VLGRFDLLDPFDNTFFVMGPTSSRIIPTEAEQSFTFTERRAPVRAGWRNPASRSQSPKNKFR